MLHLKQRYQITGTVAGYDPAVLKKYKNFIYNFFKNDAGITSQSKGAQVVFQSKRSPKDSASKRSFSAAPVNLNEKQHELSPNSTGDALFLSMVQQTEQAYLTALINQDALYNERFKAITDKMIESTLPKDTKPGDVEAKKFQIKQTLEKSFGFTFVPLKVTAISRFIPLFETVLMRDLISSRGMRTRVSDIVATLILAREAGVQLATTEKANDKIKLFKGALPSYDEDAESLEMLTISSHAPVYILDSDWDTKIDMALGLGQFHAAAFHDALSVVMPKVQDSMRYWLASAYWSDASQFALQNLYLTSSSKWGPGKLALQMGPEVSLFRGFDPLQVPLYRWQNWYYFMAQPSILREKGEYISKKYLPVDMSHPLKTISKVWSFEKPQDLVNYLSVGTFPNGDIRSVSYDLTEEQLWGCCFSAITESMDDSELTGSSDLRKFVITLVDILSQDMYHSIKGKDDIHAEHIRVLEKVYWPTTVSLIITNNTNKQNSESDES